MLINRPFINRKRKNVKKEKENNLALEVNTYDNISNTKRKFIFYFFSFHFI